MAALESRRVPAQRSGPERPALYAEKSDRLLSHSSYSVLADREAEILEVPNADGSPPYRVRWSDTGREALVMPGPDCVVEHQQGAPPPKQ